MKLKLGILENKLKEIANLNEIKLPVKLAYALAKNETALTDEFKTYLKKQIEILEKDCIRDSEGKPVLENNEYTYESEERKAQVLSELNELANMEVDINIMTLPVDILEQCNTGKFDALTTKDILTLEFMLQ